MPSTSKPKPASPQSLTTLEALQARVTRALRLPTRHERGQMLNLAEQMLDGALRAGRLSAKQVNRAEALLMPLREACKPPAGPQRAPATVGELRTLIAGLPDATRIEVLPGASPEWTAAVCKLLALVPPVQRAPAAGTGYRASRDPSRFNAANITPSAEDLGL